MKQIVLCEFVIDGVAITVYGVNIICTEICCSLLQNNLSKIIRDFIILVDGICQVIRNRCVNIISIITILLNVVCTRFTIFISNQCVRRTINNHRSGTVAIGQASNRRGILESLLNGLHITIGCLKTFTFNREFCLRDACRIVELLRRFTAFKPIVLGLCIVEGDDRVVVITGIIREAACIIPRQGICRGDGEIHRGIAINTCEPCRARVFLRAIDRRVERFTIDDEIILLNGVWVDRDITVASNGVVGIGVVGEVNVAEQELIVVGTGVSGNTIHMSILAGRIVATVADGILDTRRIKLITIGKALTCCTRFSIDVFIFERSIAIGLRCTAVQDNGTTRDFQLTFVKCCNTVAFQALKRLILDIDVIDSKFFIIGPTITICTRSRRSLTSTGQLVAAAVAVHDAAAFGNFLERVRITRNIVRVAIFADEFGFFLSRQVNGFTIDRGLIISRNGQSRLYLEDVFVRIFRLSIRVESVAALRAGVPASCRLTVEVRAEHVAVRRCGVDFPVAVRTGRDGVLCRSQVLEGTICAACINDDSIVCRRLGNQRAVVRRTVIVNGDISRLARADKLDPICSCNAVNQDVAVRDDIHMAFVCRDAVTDCDAIARDINAVVDMDDTREGCIRLVLATADIDSACLLDIKIAQRNGMTDVAFQVNTAAIAVDDKAGMRQVLFLNKAFRRASGRLNIIPVRGSAKTYRYIWARIIWFFCSFTCEIRFTIVPVGVIVFRRRAIILSELGAFGAIGIRNQSFWTSNPIVSISIRTIYWIPRIATASTTDKERIFLALARQRIF